MRIKDVITRDEFPWNYFNNLSQLLLYLKQVDKKGEFDTAK